MKRRLAVAISGHGYGHLGQTLPVLQLLLQHTPELEIVVRTSIPRERIQERLTGELLYEPSETDIGMIQSGPLAIERAESAVAYRRFHSDWQRKVDDEARALERLNTDLVLADIPYLALAGAQRAGIAAVAMCSLNWADVFRHYFGPNTDAPMLLEQMMNAYASAQCFLQPAPSMPMDWLPNRQAIGPVAQVGNDCRDQLAERMQLREGEKVVLVSMGGFDRELIIGGRCPAAIRLIVPSSWQETVPANAIRLDRLDMPFLDVLRSCDALVTKPGYGSFVEAACAGIPVVYVPREDWPETPWLVAWLEKHGKCTELAPEALSGGRLWEALGEVLDGPRPVACVPSGVAEAVEVITRAARGEG